MVSEEHASPAVGSSAAPPLVSVGVPVRNGEAHLAEALASVVAQTYDNLEVIVCDNASEDSTQAIAEQFVAADGRFRYLRHPADIGFLPNFMRALAETRGTYFTWLAFDDLLSDPSYISVLVDYLESHPDVVACASAFELSTFELAGAPEVKSLPELDPMCWPKSRREIFKWPHGWLDLVIYGMFRREKLASIPVPQRTYRGQPHIFWWETDLLTSLSALGRIVSLPTCLRTYRRSIASAGTKQVAAVSTFDMFILGIQIKLILLRRAVTLEVPVRERLRLAGTALANLLRANLQQPYDHRRAIRSLEREVSTLRQVAAERSRLIESLSAVVSPKSGDAPKSLDTSELIGAPATSTPNGPEPAQAHRRSALRDFFSPPQEWQIEYYEDLCTELPSLRRMCDDQLELIQTLHSQAAGKHSAGPTTS